jgi:hypothetical protein
VLIIALIPFRVFIIPRWFSGDELHVLDDMTANNKAVLASLGGPPIFRGEKRVQDYGIERRHSEQKRGIDRQRVGSIHR